MSTFLSPRLWKLAGWAIAGTALAAAWLVHGGPGRVWAPVTEVTTIVLVVARYIQGGRRTEAGALAAERDERQKLVGMRSKALAGNVAMIAAFIGVTAGIAVKADWWWPCVLIFGITGLAYLYGLSRFGVAEEGPAEEDEEYPAPSAARP